MLYPVCFRRRDHMNRTVPAAYKRRNGIFDIFEKKKKGTHRVREEPFETLTRTECENEPHSACEGRNGSRSCKGIGVKGDRVMVSVKLRHLNEPLLPHRVHHLTAWMRWYMWLLGFNIHTHVRLMRGIKRNNCSWAIKRRGLKEYQRKEKGEVVECGGKEGWMWRRFARAAREHEKGLNKSNTNTKTRHTLRTQVVYLC